MQNVSFFFLGRYQEKSKKFQVDKLGDCHDLLKLQLDFILLKHPIFRERQSPK